MHKTESHSTCPTASAPPESMPTDKPSGLTVLYKDQRQAVDNDTLSN